MNYRDEWFSPENVEEQIEQHLSASDRSPANTRLLQGLQHLAEDDASRLTRIRARLAEHSANGTEREPVPIQRYQHPHIQPLEPLLPLPQPPRRVPKRSRFLTNLLSGLVAVLVIGSMLAAFTLFRSHLEPAAVHPQMPVFAPPIHGSSAFLMDATSGKVLVDINSHVRFSLFDTAKIMTAVVAMENANLDQPVTIKQSMFNEEIQDTPTAHLQVGDQLQLRDLLYGLLLPSGNDAAQAIAQVVAGDMQKFVDMMNEEAQQLQLNDTHFASPYGAASAEDYSSAEDLTRLGWFALRFSDFAHIVAQQEYTLPATEKRHFYLWSNTNLLLLSYAGMNGVTLSYDGNMSSMVLSARRNNHQLVGTELRVPSMNTLVSDVKMLLDRGFASIPPDPTPTPMPPTHGDIVSEKKG